MKDYELELEFKIEDKHDYSFTFTIPAFKNVYHSKKRCKYGQLTNKQQFTLIERVMYKNVSSSSDVRWIYEKHDDERLHLHGYWKNTYREEVEDLRNKFYQDYSININSYVKYEKISDIQETKTVINYWEKYMEKNQDKIIYKCGFIHQKEITDDLNKGIIKIECNIPQDYLNTLDQHLENELLEDEYKFGKTKLNKYIIEI